MSWRGVGFGDAEGLRLSQRLVEGKALLHFAEDHIRGGIENSVEALHVDGGHLLEERENRDAIHHRRFEQEFLSASLRQVAQFTVGVDDGAFVGGDGVGSVLEGSADVVDAGLAIFYVEGCGFKQHIGACGGEP